MTLPFKPGSFSAHEQAIFTSLPKLCGAVVCPDYWPKESRARGEREFIEWCDTHPVEDWPKWVHEWRFRYRITHGLIAEPAGGQNHDLAGIGADHARRPVAGGLT